MVRRSPIKVTVLGMGNMLLRDEGIGVHIAHALQGAPAPGKIELEVVDGATSPDAPLSFEDVDKLIIVDAVRSGGEPGSIYRFRPEDIKLDNRTLTSLHQISLLENLWLLEKFRHKPENVVIIGIEPEDMSWGLELSARLKKQMPEMIRIVLEEIGLSIPANLRKRGRE